MPRHSPILQILVYFYSKQEKCNIYSYIFIYIYILKPVTKKRKKEKEKNVHIANTAFRENFISKPGKKILVCLKHTYTQILFYPCTCFNTVNLF